jgi:hypothetical protein
MHDITPDIRPDIKCDIMPDIVISGMMPLPTAWQKAE